ncbi:MAG: dependent oxidoreductase [Frankiales bacterium]|nr:dependent oxidoreductase [Frankiales bacterium]
MAEDPYRGLSLWHDGVPSELTPRPSLATAGHRERTVDVAIVGAGFTGLWTAYYLKRAEPSLRVAICESEIAGFGASGRNGGWCSALFPVSLTKLAEESGREAAIAQYQAMRETVTEIGRVIAEEGLDADWARGGTVTLARSAPQLQRALAEVAEARKFGFDEDYLRLLSDEQARAELNADGVVGGVFAADCAAIQPAKLVRSLAARVQASGVAIYERTRVSAIEPGRLRTEHGDLRAEFVVRATEGFTPALAGLKRAIAPVYSLMIATEPLSEQRWADIGLSRRQTFTDLRHLIIYGQRTADDRLVFGGRGAPYHFGSSIGPSHDRAPRVFAALRHTLSELLPMTRELAITHQWGGPLGIARDWHASAGLDRSTGIGWAGGYVGDGVATTNLAGRTLVELILGRPSPLTELAWVNHLSPSWEPEPLRWLGANAGLRAMTWADDAEQRHGRKSLVAAAVNRVMGR